MELGIVSCLACYKSRLKPENLSHLKPHRERSLHLAWHAGVNTESVSLHTIPSALVSVFFGLLFLPRSALCCLFNLIKNLNHMNFHIEHDANNPIDLCNSPERLIRPPDDPGARQHPTAPRPSAFGSPLAESLLPLCISVMSSQRPLWLCELSLPLPPLSTSLFTEFTINIHYQHTMMAVLVLPLLPAACSLQPAWGSGFEGAVSPTHMPERQ